MRRSSALPPVPVTDEQLEPLVEHDRVREVWVPDGRPRSVHTRAGAHDGDVLKFWIETGDGFVPFTYTSGDESGLGWHRGTPTRHDEDEAELIERIVRDDYQPLQEGSA
jgi:hypothetical protein